jgi:anti-sigma B factor antagonist
MRRTTFSTSVTVAGRDAVVLVRGELDLATASALETAVMGYVDRGFSTVGVDLAAVTFMDTSGVNAIMACRQRATGPGATVSLSRASRSVRRILTLTETDALLAA